MSTNEIDHLMAQDVSVLDEDAALDCIGMLIDAAADHGRGDSTDRAFVLVLPLGLRFTV